MTRATAFEFRYRFFILGLIFWFGYAFGSLLGSRITVAEMLANWTGHPTVGGVKFFFAVGGLVVCLAAAVRTWATAYLRGDIVHDMELHSHRLIADGPYRHLRNPLYLGTILMACGIGVLYNWAGWLLIVAGVTIFNLRLIGREEEALLVSQGQSFEAFKKAVPCLIPSLSPRLPAAGQAPHWGQALFAESFMWAFALALGLFAITLDTRLLSAIMFFSLCCYAILHVVNSRRKQKSEFTKA